MHSFALISKFGEMPYHMVRSRRFKDLYEHVLFNYEWLHAKLSSCPLQAGNFFLRQFSYLFIN